MEAAEPLSIKGTCAVRESLMARFETGGEVWVLVEVERFILHFSSASLGVKLELTRPDNGPIRTLPYLGRTVYHHQVSQISLQRIPKHDKPG